MRPWLHLLVLLACSLCGGRAMAQAEEAQRQVLVMLQLPKAHYRPDGSYAGTYGEGVGRQSREQTARSLARAHGLQMSGEWAMPLAGVDCFVMRLPEGDTRTSAQAARAVTGDRRVAWAQPVGLYQAQGAQQEPLYAAQPAARQWHLAELHRLATGRGVRVAVVDSGVEAGHPDLAGQVALNENFVDDRPPPAEGHGTAVAGIIAARADNGLGIAGVAPQARLLALRACWQAAGAQTLCTSLGLARALYAAIQQRADIINMSLGGPDDRLLGLLLDQAQARGATIVAALPSAGGPFPANHPGVLVVGSAPPLPEGAVTAPGLDVPSTVPGGGWALVSGSSFAAAHAAGLLALVCELDGGRKGPLQRTALVTGPRGGIDSCATLARHAGTRGPACTALRQTVD
ncbi:S8 family peptidase [Pelomonas aquatica]|jgi:subtilisin family serine protease|uniref:Serine protease n=1 Tax=Pelomonas aquatica TaxID=431058 RepID=A0A9X4LCC1_9BURK|nr:S8 family serine peptidase [Pelomonas aquatica]MCY4753869.1 S8 family serine peptidase [Pelomonas aquatica]MDG0861196.1 serine protease [Pelomonas aquatica]